MSDLEGLFQAAGVISMILSIVLLVTFFVMAYNISKIRRAIELRLAPGPITRNCPSCQEAMRRRASVCPNCGRESAPWWYDRGYWWVKNDAGETFWLDERSGGWVRAEAAE